jgi:hypothetical protein
MGAIASDEPPPLEPLPEPELLPVELPPGPQLLPPDEASAPVDPSGAVPLLLAQPTANTRRATESSFRRIIEVYISQQEAGRS